MLQWRYIAGNNWGMCEDGTGAVGCGPQEEFRACADINIGDVGPQPPLRPIRPGTGKPTTRAPVTEPPTAPAADAEDGAGAEDGPRYLGPIIALAALLVVVCVLATIYLYSYHGQRIKQLLHWNRTNKQPAAATAEPWSTPVSAMPPPSVGSVVAPVAPPRAKRLSQQSLGDCEASGPSVFGGASLK